MADNPNPTPSVSLTFPTYLWLAFWGLWVLKVAGLTTVSWWTVFIPLFALVVLGLLSVLAAGIAVAIQKKRDAKELERRAEERREFWKNH